MHSGNWFLALPTYFLIGPEGLIGNVVLLGSLMYVGIKREEGWRAYILSALCPTCVQTIMLMILGLMTGQADKVMLYAIISLTSFLSLYLIYRSFMCSVGKVVRVLVMCSQIYMMALACFVGLMSVNNNWL